MSSEHWIRIFDGEPKEALPLIQKAFALSPRDGLAGVWRTASGTAYLLLGDDVKAEREARTGIAENPKHSQNYAVLAAALAHQGRLEEARAALQTAIELRPSQKTIADVVATSDGRRRNSMAGASRVTWTACARRACRRADHDVPVRTGPTGDRWRSRAGQATGRAPTRCRLPCARGKVGSSCTRPGGQPMTNDPLLQPYRLKHLRAEEPDHVDGARAELCRGRHADRPLPPLPCRKGQGRHRHDDDRGLGHRRRGQPRRLRQPARLCATRSSRG